MSSIYRPKVPVGSCTTLADASRELGFGKENLRMHKERGTHGFPRPVARFGQMTLYVMEEIDAFTRSVAWKQADKNIAHLELDPTGSE